MSFKFDLKKFKKVATDKHSTTLKHPAGHEIKIAHGPLSPKMRSQLAEMPSHEMKMAEGGAVNKDDIPLDKEKAKKFSEDFNKPFSFKEAINNVKEGFKPPQKKMADGGEVADTQPMDSQQKQAPVVVNVQQPAAPEQKAPEEQGGIAKALGALGSMIMGVKKPDGEAAMPQQSPEPASLAPQQEAMAGQQQMQQQQSPQDPYGTAATQGAFQQGLQSQKQGLQGQAAASSNEAQLRQQALEEQQAKQEDLMASNQKHIDALNTERQGFMDAVKDQKIDPNRYLANRTVPQRIGNAIGLLLGGMGAGLLHQENPAMKFIQNQIDRDIESQKAELGKKENLLSNNLKQFGNQKDAFDMTRIQMNDMTANQLQQAAAKSGSQQAQAIAQQKLGELYSQNAQLVGNMAMRRTLLGGAAKGQIDPSKMLMAVDPKDKESARKELKEYSETAAFRDNILSTFDQLAKIDTVGNRAAHAGFTPPQVAALRDPLIAQLSKGLAGRFSEADAKMIAPLLSLQGNDEKSVAVKRQQLDKLTSEKLHPTSFPTLQEYNFPLSSISRYTASGEDNIKKNTPVPIKK